MHQWQLSSSCSTCFPAFRVVTTSNCERARFSAHDPKVKGLVFLGYNLCQGSSCNTPALKSNLLSILLASFGY